MIKKGGGHIGKFLFLTIMFCWADYNQEEKY